MKKVFFILIPLLVFVGCTKKMPTEKDGSLSLKIIIADNSGALPVDTTLGYAPVCDAEVILSSNKYSISEGNPVKYRSTSDSAGVAVFTDMVGSTYLVNVEATQHILNPNTGGYDNVVLRGSMLVDIYQSESVEDTLKTALSISSDLVINEIYYCGPVSRSYYYSDQFVELYNSSEDTVYLDGIILCRARQYQHPNMETMDFLQAIYVFQFPGDPLVGREYPLPPKEFSVVAQDAFDHTMLPGLEESVDLSGADWEFYNPYSGDWDSPAPNVINQLPENGADFMINLVHNAVILADGSDYYYGEFIDNGDQYIHVPLSTVLDAVEYSANPEKQKEITLRVDAGFAGIGIAKYSGRSTERRLAGFDSNNSNLDFVNLDKPTPGWQHE